MRGIGDNLNMRWEINHSYTKKKFYFIYTIWGFQLQLQQKLLFLTTEFLQLRKLHLNVIRKYNKT